MAPANDDAPRDRRLCPGCGGKKTRGASRCRACYRAAVASTEGERVVAFCREYLKRNARTVPARSLGEALAVHGLGRRRYPLSRALGRLEREGAAVRLGDSWMHRDHVPANVTDRSPRLSDETLALPASLGATAR